MSDCCTFSLANKIQSRTTKNLLIKRPFFAYSFDSSSGYPGLVSIHIVGHRSFGWHKFFRNYVYKDEGKFRNLSLSPLGINHVIFITLASSNINRDETDRVIQGKGGFECPVFSRLWPTTYVSIYCIQLLETMNLMSFFSFSIVITFIIF